MSGRKIEFDENEALENAAEVFWLKGYESASTEDLLTAMKLNKGSMYNTFGNKRQLFLHAFHGFAKRFLQNINNIFKKHDNPVEAIKEIFYRHADVISANRQVSPLLNTAPEPGDCHVLKK